MSEELKSHLDRIEGKVDEHITHFSDWKNSIHSAFPKDDEGQVDYRGHKEYHKKLIDDAAMYQAARARTMEKVISGGVWGAIVLMGTAVWHYLIAKIGGA